MTNGQLNLAEGFVLVWLTISAMVLVFAGLLWALPAGVAL